MDLSALGSTLPPGLADAEREMGDKFRAAALSITNLYKSSLSYTKQAYHVGYSACLADVLSTVQSSIAGGQDASQTLSRLMDWAEAREAAMAAFAADESDEPGPVPASTSTAPIPIRRAALAKQALSHLTQQPQRPASAPLPDHIHMRQYEDSSPGPSRSSTTTSTPNHDSSVPPLHSWQATPVHLASSSPTTSSASSSVPRPPIFHTGSHLRKHHHSPVRTSHRVDVATAGHPPSSSFSPALPQLPTAGVPFVTSSQGPTLPIGSKRTLVDFEMAEDPAGHGTTRSTPSRAAKRRSLGGTLGKDEGMEGDKDKDRRRGGRRGHGAGPGSGVI